MSAQCVQRSSSGFVEATPLLKSRAWSAVPTFMNNGRQAASRCEVVTVPCPRDGAVHKSGIQPGVPRAASSVSALTHLGGDAHQALCWSCLRQSPVLHGTEDAVAARLADLGWSAQMGAHCCPICLDRAELPANVRSTTLPVGRRP